MMNQIRKTKLSKKFLCVVSMCVFGSVAFSVIAQNALPTSAEPKILFSKGDIVVMEVKNFPGASGVSCHLGIPIPDTKNTILSFAQLSDSVEISSINHWSPVRYPPNGSYASVRVFGGEQLVGTGEGITDGTDIVLASSLDMDELAHLFRSQDSIAFEFFGDPKLGAGGSFGRHILVRNPADMQNIGAAFDKLFECAEE